jgi:hypothetical protein
MSEHAPELSALESKLTTLTPLPSAVDRDYLLFQAGRASVRRNTWVWQAATACLIVAVAGLTLALLSRPVPSRGEPITVERIVYLPAPPATAPASSTVFSSPKAVEPVSVADEDRWADQAENLRHRQQVMRFGVDALPEPRSRPTGEKALPMDPLMGLPASTLDEGAGRMLLGLHLGAGPK